MKRAPRRLYLPLPVGTLLLCQKVVIGDVSQDHDRLLILKYKGRFREYDPWDAAHVYLCLDPIKQVKVELYDWYKRAPVWKPIPID